MTWLILKQMMNRYQFRRMLTGVVIGRLALAIVHKGGAVFYVA